MKYIRTKDGRIIDTLDERGMLIKKTRLIPNYKDCVLVQNKSGDFIIPNDEIIKMADTVEELCDEFVVIGYKIKDPFVFSKEGISIDNFWKHSPSDTIVYGAIWCEFGLKYVAKMNEEGELELL